MPVSTSDTMEMRLKQVVNLTRELREPHTLEELLQLMIDRVTWVIDAKRASVRLLDASGQRLFAVSRSGTSLHQNPLTEFTSSRRRGY